MSNNSFLTTAHYDSVPLQKLSDYSRLPKPCPKAHLDLEPLNVVLNQPGNYSHNSVGNAYASSNYPDQAERVNENNCCVIACCGSYCSTRCK